MVEHRGTGAWHRRLTRLWRQDAIRLSPALAPPPRLRIPDRLLIEGRWFVVVGARSADGPWILQDAEDGAQIAPDATTLTLARSADDGRNADADAPGPMPRPWTLRVGPDGRSFALRADAVVHVPVAEAAEPLRRAGADRASRRGSNEHRA
ncbi:MAG: hypothetical protein AAF772_06570 [Acidobacteriota bacterium]